MIDVRDLADVLGGLLSVEVLGATSDPPVAVVDVGIAEPGPGEPCEPGELVLGVAVAEVGTALELLRAGAEVGVAGVVLRRVVATDRQVVAAARRHGVALLGLADEAAWAHVVWLLRGAIDRAQAAERHTGQDSQDDLFALADAAARLVDGPVTIEDAWSRVLAYSARQDLSETTRVSTIVGRRVPEEVLSVLRATGVFRRLASSSQPVWLPAPADGSRRARLVVPVRAGGEWLGSIWAIVESRPPDEVVGELTRTASVVALHLLRLRSRTDLGQRVVRERLRQALTGSTTGAQGWLPPAPLRVVALGPGTGLELWESLLRRWSWSHPQVVDVDGRDYAVVGDRGGSPDVPGSWPWLRGVVQAQGRGGAGVEVRAGAGGLVQHPAQLTRSRAEAQETLVTLERDPAGPVAATIDEAWAQVTTNRAVHGLGPEPVLGPLAVLREQDRTSGSGYLLTLAAWLEHPGEPGAAANEIHVHPNTLRYRMQRITELVDVDLRHPDARLALQLQLRAIGQRV